MLKITMKPRAAQAPAEDWRTVNVTKGAAEAGKALGVTTVDALLKMVRHAAPLTHAKANFRYEKLMFFVDSNTLYGVFPFEAPANDRTRPILRMPAGASPKPFEDRRPRRSVGTPSSREARGGLIEAECPLCKGEGCAECNDTGRIKRSKEAYQELVDLALFG